LAGSAVRLGQLLGPVLPARELLRVRRPELGLQLELEWGQQREPRSGWRLEPEELEQLVSARGRPGGRGELPVRVQRALRCVQDQVAP
jgi:hypothetical protein